MSAVRLESVVAGFADPVFDSQRVFRAALEAVAHPGTIVTLSEPCAALPGVEPAAAALLLALLDADTRLWLSPSCASGPAAASFRFHTGCRIAQAPGECDFALVAAPAELSPFADFERGTDAHPERSASVVLQVPALAAEPRWRVSGPGVKGERPIAVPALGADFLAEWERKRLAFPRGIDLYLACGTRLCALPRTARIAA